MSPEEFVTEKFVDDVPVSPLTVTLIFPVLAAAGSVVFMVVVVQLVTTEAVPLNVTMLLAGTVLNFVPTIVIVPVVPVCALVGLKLETVGVCLVILMVSVPEQVPDESVHL